MGMTLTQKILAAHAGLAEVKAGQLINAKLDLGQTGFVHMYAKPAGRGGIHPSAVLHEQYQLPADRAYTLDVNLELF